tara:strand:- start:31 stop:246 length:216 start_codon:yes stop_codon:yes gene_type:complete
MAKKQKTDLQVFQEWVQELKELVFGTPIKDAMVKPKRARGKKGKFLADDKSTKDFNEAWVGGKAPKKKRKK